MTSLFNSYGLKPNANSMHLENCCQLDIPVSRFLWCIQCVFGHLFRQLHIGIRLIRIYQNLSEIVPKT